MTEPEIDPLSQLANELKDAIEKQDWDRVVKAGTQFVGWCVTAKIEREDRKHDELIAELSGIRDALELHALAAIKAGSNYEVVPPAGVGIYAKILARQKGDSACMASEPCLGEPVE